MKIIFSKLKPYLPLVFITIVCLFTSVMCDLYLPTLMSNIVNQGISTGNTSLILSIGAEMLGISLSSMAASICTNYLSSKAAMGFGRDLRAATFRKITSYSLHEVDKIGTASLITRNTNDVIQIQMVIMMGMRMMVDMPLHLIGGLIYALRIDLELSVILLIAVPVLACIILLNLKFTTPLFRLMQTKMDNLNRVMREKLSGVRVIRAFNAVDREKKRFNDTNYDLTQNALRASRRMAIMHPATMMVMNASVIAVLGFGAMRIESGGMMSGDVMAYLQYLMQILGSVMMANMMIMMIPRAIVSMRRVAEVLNMESELNDPEVPKIPEEGVRGSVSFENVSFAYPGAEEPVLKNISFETRPGETTAIIGATGSGKSTLVNLIPRFYDTTSGTIRVDGLDIRDMAQEDLRNRIGYVPQKALLFTGTISENIRYGKSDATDEEVRKAAEIAQAAEFIEKMPDGYDSILSQDATNVSGGQKQRISIARALARQPEIYIFDDSFSALDFKTDAMLREALKPVTQNSTVIIVAQRVATVMSADRIIVLDDGEMVGYGTHAELLNSCEVYREIVSSQLSEEEIA